ncbi:UNVERIFIED_CONTAM: hypothetical protein K2H54_010507 [Gekko kuhli]
MCVFHKWEVPFFISPPPQGSPLSHDLQVPNISNPSLCKSMCTRLPHLKLKYVFLLQDTPLPSSPTHTWIFLRVENGPYQVRVWFSFFFFPLREENQCKGF